MHIIVSVINAALYILFSFHEDDYQANMRRWPKAVLMLGQRRRRWTNIKTALGQRLKPDG